MAEVWGSPLPSPPHRAATRVLVQVWEGEGFFFLFWPCVLLRRRQRRRPSCLTRWPCCDTRWRYGKKQIFLGRREEEEAVERKKQEGKVIQGRLWVGRLVDEWFKAVLRRRHVSLKQFWGLSDQSSDEENHASILNVFAKKTHHVRRFLWVLSGCFRYCCYLWDLIFSYTKHQVKSELLNV